MLLLDTNVLSELRKVRSGRGHPSVARWSSALGSEPSAISSVTLVELEIGVHRLERRDPEQGRILRDWFEHAVVEGFAGRILPFDEAAARVCAALHSPSPRPLYDTMIAATALTRGLTLVTRNVRDFEGMGVRLLNPWELPG